VADTDVIAIPVNDPAIKAIGGALFKPAGAGPFPGVIYMLDSFTPRNEPKDACANLGNLDGEKAMQYVTRGSNDALAAVAVLKAMPEIDAKHIFLAGFSLAGTSSLLANDTKNPASRGAGVAGVIAYYPFCYDGVDPSVPVLALVGEKDDWTPAAKCQAVTGKSNFELVVYPGITHAFAVPFPKPTDNLGHHLVYDEKATQDAQQRADAFMAARMK
jgi:dienelactone hydrolase